MKKLGIMVIAVALLVVGFATAAYLPEETPETSVISSVGSLKCTGTTFTDTDIVFAIGESSGCGKCCGASSIVGSTGVYVNDLLAHGNTQYVSSVEVDTSNKLNNQNNIETSQILTFVGTGAVYDEGAFMMGAGTGQKDTDSICPFGKTDAPAFCNKVEASTNFMGKSLDYQSASGMRIVAETQDIPVEFTFSENAIGSGAFDVQYSLDELEARKLTKNHHTPTPAAGTEFDQRYRAVGVFDVNTAFSYISGIEF